MNPDTVSAANKLLSIFDLLRGTGHEVPDEIGCSDAALSVFEGYYPVPLPQDLRDFLTLILPAGSLDIGVFKSLPPARLLREQQDAVPFEGNMKHGFFGLGWWTGDADGDGWLYDLQNGRIYAVMLYHNDEESREAIHDLAYHDFGSFKEWVDFLYAECQERGWIPEQQPKG
jgi:hypothetical protein